MEEKLNLLTSMRIGVSSDKELVRVDLIGVSKEKTKNDVFTSFVIPVEAYQSMISSFIKAGIKMESELCVDLGFKSTLEGEDNEEQCL